MLAIVGHLWPVWYFAACFLGGWAAASGLLSEMAPAWIFLSVWPLWFASRYSKPGDWFLVCVGCAIHGVSFSAIVHFDLLNTFSGFLGPIWFCLALLGGIAPVAAMLLFWILPRGVTPGVAIPYFAACWVCGEWIRYWVSVILDGIGTSGLWIGVSLVEWPLLVQAADLGGVSVLSFTLVLLSVGLAQSSVELLAACGNSQWTPIHSRFIALKFTLGALGLTCAYGASRLAMLSADTTGINVLLAACAPTDPASEARMPDDVRKRLEAADVVVFPEGIGGDIAERLWTSTDNPTSATSADAGPASRGVVVLGSIVVQADQMLNLAITKDRFGARYETSKVFPVPVVECQSGLSRYLVEYLLPAGVFPLLKTEVRQRRDLDACPNVELRNGDHVQVRPTICYDVLFSTAHWRSTNDVSIPAIYAGLSMESASTIPEPQTLSLRHAQLRVIENRIPYVRSVFAGVSAVIDRSGRIVVSERHKKKGGWVGIVGTVRTAPTWTIYSRFGEVFAIVCGMTVAASWWFRRKAVPSKTESNVLTA